MQGIPGRVEAQSRDTVINKFAVKADLVPLYFDIFDNREQARIGLDFEMNYREALFISFYWDMGLYDHYSFIKYYDFFNQGPGFYSVEQKIKITGFHFMPAYNYYFWHSKVKSHQGMYAGGILDINYYRRLYDVYNSNLDETNSGKNHQFRMGAGLSLGGKYCFGSQFFVEIKTSFLAKIFKVASDKDIQVVKPINAQWVDIKNNFWWVSNLNLGYAF